MTRMGSGVIAGAVAPAAGLEPSGGVLVSGPAVPGGNPHAVTNSAASADTSDDRSEKRLDTGTTG
jgi:hypothetical protein